MKLSQNSAVETVIIVAGLLLGFGGLISVQEAVVQFVLSFGSWRFDPWEALRLLLPAPSIQLFVASMMVLRPSYIRRATLLPADGSGVFTGSESREFWLCCVRIVGVTLLVHCTAMLLRSYLFMWLDVLFWSPMSKHHKAMLAFDWVPIPIALVAVLAPDAVCTALRLEYAEPESKTAEQLGDQILRRSAIIGVAWLTLFVVTSYCLLMALSWIERSDGEFEFSSPRFVCVAAAALVGFPCWIARGRLAIWLAEQGQSVCTGCGIRFVVACTSCCECESPTVGFISEAERPALIWTRNWIAVLLTSMVVLSLPVITRFICTGNARPPFHFSDWSLFHPSRRYAAGAFFAIGTAGLLLPLRYAVAHLLPRATFHGEILIRSGGLLLIFQAINHSYVLLADSQWSYYPDRSLARNALATSAFAHSIVGLIVLCIPLTWLARRASTKATGSS